MKSNKFVFSSVATALAFALSACGGGGGGGVTSTPTPPPGGGGGSGGGSGGGGGGGTPAPTPPPSNANGDLTGTLLSETFTNVAASASLSANSTSVTVSEGAITATIVYDADTQSYTLETPGGSITFAPTDIDDSQSNSGAVVYSITNGDTTNTLTLTRPGTSGALTFQYVGSAFWQSTTVGTTTGSGRIESIVYGVETPDGGVPSTGSADYAIDLIGAVTVGENVSGLAGIGTASVDFVSGNMIIVGQLTLAPFLGSDSSFSGVASLSSSSGAFSGTFRLNDFGQFDGDIAGRLFGPNAEEIGGAFSLSNIGADRVATGTIMGRQDNTPPNTQFNDDEPLLDNSQTFTATETVLSFNAVDRSGQPGFLNFDSIGTAQSQLSIRYDANSERFLFSGDGVEGLLDPVFGFQNLGPRTRASISSSRLTYVNASGWKLSDPDNLSPTSRHSFFVYGFETPVGDLPTTGSAGYTLNFSGSGVDPDYNADLLIDGTGVLIADFETGVLDLSGGLNIRENIFLSGVPSFQTVANLTGSGMIASGVNSFSGTLSFDSLGNYTGTFDGSFFGPAAEETGGTFTAADDNGQIVGSFIGEQDDTLTGGQTLAGATEPVDAYALFTTGGSLPRGDDVRFDPATGTYEIVVNPDSQQEFSLALSTANLDQAQSNDTFSVYTRPGEPGVIDRILTPGDANSAIALTYTSFAQIGLQTSPRGLESQTMGVFGIQTPSAALPKAGSGTYDGVVFAIGEVAPTGYRGEINGTSELIADFSAGTLGLTFNLTQADAMNTVIGTYLFDGTIATNGFFGGARQGEGFVGSLNGAFFGPNAQEFGAAFDIIDDVPAGRTFIEGVTVGKRR
ncbi:transferrin-binding protein-like solute binding protein [Erythrobacter insulae]|uniref:Transferrin-binding protein-like solute binding protein n=1 Tax=Erythrobacter insulae TaxID=2584124 RepID=A0A547PCR3_9SPHN|nr:transferrin-binding protein-like solute binding protein [Erythrobacter insulae]TRD11931.1 transferrin-binding protein-like solute binding protein [Erythrobacter insulae]